MNRYLFNFVLKRFLKRIDIETICNNYMNFEIIDLKHK